ncbi:MAG: phosphate/phosphite/phosphonate ABC transporter substrate-binding protein [Trueperaceae bacterium]
MQQHGRCTRVLMVVLVTVGLSGAAAQSSDCLDIEVGPSRPLTLAYIPQENPEKLVDDVEVISDYLEQELGVPVDGFVALDHAAAVEALRNCTADISFMGGLPYVLAHELAGAEVILGEVYRGNDVYHGRIFVRADSDIETIEDLRGRSVAFADPISESGYLYPLDILVQAGLLQAGDDPQEFFGNVYFAGGYQQAVESVINGFVDAAGASEYVTVSLRPDQLQQIRWIAESDPIPSHAVIARRGFSPELAETFTVAMLKLNEPDYRHLLQYVYSPDGYVRVEDSAYDGVRDLARRYGLVAEVEQGE